jgi:transposase
VIEKLEEKYPNQEIEIWFFDEHRVGLKPILRKVWSKIGQRPLAVVSHRYEWLYVYGFVEPKTGRTLWYLIPRVNTEWLNLVFKKFARDVGSENKRIWLLEDNAGWHRSQKVEVPPGITIEFLPPCSPDLQPAERLWTLVDEPLVNEYFETLDEMEEILVQRCNLLAESSEMRENIKNLTYYSWLRAL